MDDHQSAAAANTTSNSSRSRVDGSEILSIARHMIDRYDWIMEIRSLTGPPLAMVPSATAEVNSSGGTVDEKDSLIEANIERHRTIIGPLLANFKEAMMSSIEGNVPYLTEQPLGANGVQFVLDGLMKRTDWKTTYQCDDGELLECRICGSHPTAAADVAE